MRPAPPSVGAAAGTVVPAWCAPWTISQTPNPGANSNYLESIAATATNDVWAAGSDCTTSAPLAEHGNGTSWSLIPAPAYSRRTPLSQVSGINAFDGVAARASNDVWAVGQGADRTALAEHWSGTSWNVVPTQKVNAISQFNAVTAVPNSQVLWAVGDDGPDPFTNSYPLIEEWTGSQWAVSPAVNSTTTNSGDNLEGIVAPSAGSAWAVGQGEPYGGQTLAERHYAPQPAPEMMCP